MRAICKYVIGIMLVLIFLNGCSNSKFKEYTGENLTIGVIGEIPRVREKNIIFTQISFNDLNIDSTFNTYDAIFITKDNLEEASKSEYTSIYTECKKPFFFIEDTKGHLPFIDDNLNYDDAPDSGNPPSYICGILKENDTLIFREFGLYNDIENKENIEDVYSRVFVNIYENQKE